MVPLSSSPPPTRSPRHMRNKSSPDPLRFSLAVLAAIVLFAATGLALDGNWPKLVRVSLAAVVYLAPLTLWSSSKRNQECPPWWMFAGSGSLAGLVSGILQPVFGIALLFTQFATASLILGTVHWLAVRYGHGLHHRPA